MTRQRAQAAAHAHRLDDILDAVVEPMVVYDLQTRIVRSNAAFQEALARLSQNPTGATMKDRADGIGAFDIHGNALAQAQWPQSRMLRGESITSADPALIVTRNASGAEDVFSVTGGPMYEEGKITGAVVFFRDITERRRARADLQRANERFGLAERAVNGFVYEWNPREGIHFRSEGFERLLGYQPEEIAPTWAAWAQLVYPGDWQVTTDAEEVAYLDALPGETLENEYRMRHRDGRYLTVAEHALIERDQAGHVARLIGQIHDITERKQEEDALRQSEERLRLLIESAEDYAIFTLDANGVINSWNEGARRIFGWSAQEIIGQQGAILFTPEDRAAGAPARELTTALQEGRAPDERFHLRKDGSRFYVSGVVAPIHDGELRGFVKIARDLTERKQAGEALRESEAGFRALADLVPDLLWRTDPSGQQISYNQRWRDYTGQTLEETQVYGWLLAIHPADRMATYAAFSRAVATGQPLELEHRVRRYDGEYRWFLVRHTPVRDERGRITQWFGAATDIHDRRMALVLLERQVAGRTRQLDSANQELRRLSQRVLQVQESERRLIARELHDEIGQQFTGAKMLLDSLDERLHATQQAPPAEQAQRDEPEQQMLEHLSQVRAVVSEMLEYVRALSLDLRPAVLDDLGLLAALQWLFERYTKQTGVEVNFAADGLDHRLPTQLEAGVYRLVQEALTNVARHADVSKVTVQIYVTDEALSLFIVDSGAGFDVEEALVGGASTGLAGMRERADLLGGSLTIDSIPGEGTTIHAEIPIPLADEMEATQESERDASRAPEDELRGRAREQRRDAARDARRDALRDVLRDMTRDAAWNAARDSARGAPQNEQQPDQQRDGQP